MTRWLLLCLFLALPAQAQLLPITTPVRALQDVTAGESIAGTFTFSGGNAALIDDNAGTAGADPSGLTASTYFRVDFGVGDTKTIREVYTKTHSSNGFANQGVFDIDYSDNDSDWTTVTTHTVSAGTSQENTTSFASAGAHRYWRLIYNSGTTSGNAWLQEIELREYQ